ncbi:C4BPA protein, partial [Serilophus lunatus]|nr:C4BPA protein [Serilophus lunatus]
TCGAPERLHYAELQEEFRGKQSFAVGSQVSFVCRPGYMRSPGKSLTLTCGADLQWAPKEQFCTERSCKYPEQVDHGFIDVTDLKLGSVATFSCEKGYRLVGDDKISCVIRGEGVDWDKQLPFCEIIPCGPPPSITNGRYTEAANYVYQISVTYSCVDIPRGTVPFSLIGSDTIVCTSDEHSNGVWSGPPPQCRVVKCENPKVENAKKISGFGPTYIYKDSVQFECDPGYSMEGSAIITCEENNNWSPKPTCNEIVAELCEAPEVRNGVVIPVKSAYERGESVQIKCNAHCSFPDGTGEMTVTCQEQRTWSSFQNCACSTPAISSGFTPVISHGRVVKGQKHSYSVGDRITIECYAGYTLHGEAQIEYTRENQWAPAVPTCHLSGYIIAIICVLVAVVVLLAAFWAYKKFFSQNGKRDSTPCTAEYKMCKA